MKPSIQDYIDAVVISYGFGLNGGFSLAYEEYNYPYSDKRFTGFQSFQGLTGLFMESAPFEESLSYIPLNHLFSSKIEVSPNNLEQAQKKCWLYTIIF